MALTEQDVKNVESALNHAQFQIINGDLVAFFPGGMHSTFRPWNSEALSRGLVSRVGWQFFSPFNQTFIEVEDDSIAKRLSDEYLKVREQQRADQQAKITKEAARPMTGEEVRAWAVGIKARVIRAIVGNTHDRTWFRAIDPQQFDTQQLKGDFALAGLVWLGAGFYGHELKHRAARGTDADWADTLLLAAEKRAMSKLGSGRAEIEKQIREGKLFD